MTESQDQAESDRPEQPGKTRTWWHPLLTRLLAHELSSAYTVQDEVLVGKMPLRVDILLIRRESGELSEESLHDLDALVPLLNHYTLIEFKGPTDVIEAGDVAQLFGCAFLWHSQQPESVATEEVSLIVLAPSVNEPLRDELRRLRCQVGEREPGIHRLTGAPFTTWLVETDVMAERSQPILSLVSRVFLRDRRRIIEELRRTGHVQLLNYVLQQIQQFRWMGEEFAMQHTDTEHLGEVEEELQAAVLAAIPTEKRLQGLSAEDRLQGLSLEERTAGLSEEQLAELQDMLDKRSKKQT